MDATESKHPVPATLDIVTEPHGELRRGVPEAEAKELIAKGKARPATDLDKAIG